MNRTVAIVVVAATLVLFAFLSTSTEAVVPVPHPLNASPAPSHLELVPPNGKGVTLAPVVATGGSVTLSAKLSGRYVPVGPSEVLAMIDLSALTPPAEVRHPVNLALVLDRSGSMCGEKFTDARRAALHLVSLLQPADRLAIVHYGSDVSTLPSVFATSEGRAEMVAFLEQMSCNGSTFTSGAMIEAAALVTPHVEDFRASRIILVSDGRPTVGQTSAYELGRLAREISERNVAVPALGVGVDFDEQLMSAIAREGAGLFGYLKDSARMKEIFAAELQMATGLAARGLALNLTAAPNVRVLEVLGHSPETTGGATQVSLPDLRVGQTTRLIVRLEVTGIKPQTAREVLTAQLAYHDTLADTRRAADATLSATVTTSDALIAAHLDEEVRVTGLRQLGAKTIAKAAQAVREGRREEALNLFGNVRALFGASAEALSGDISAVEAAESELSRANSSQFNELGKSYHSKSIKSFNTYSY